MHPTCQVLADLSSLFVSERQHVIKSGAPLEFRHTLEDQIGGQLDAGFIVTRLYEDGHDTGDGDLLTEYLPAFIATRAVKPTLLSRPATPQ